MIPSRGDLLYAASVRLAVVALILAAGAWAQDDPWAFVHPKATFIGGMSWQSVKNSEFSQVLQKELPGKSTVKSSGEFDFIERLDFALLSMPSQPGSGSETKNMLAVMRGKFDLVKLHAMAAKEGA